MASTLTLLTATRYALKYRLSSDGALDAEITQAQMVADSPPLSYIGLRLAAPVNLADWSAAPDGADLSVYVTARSTAAGAIFVQVGPDLVMRVPACAAGEANVEVRFIHSAVR